MEDYFAEAVDRLRTGEPIERILAGYPDDVRRELHALLAVVELAERVATAAPPQRVPHPPAPARVCAFESTTACGIVATTARARFCLASDLLLC